MLVKRVVVDGTEDFEFAGVGKYEMIVESFPFELHGTGGGGGIRKFAFDVGDEDGGACGEVGRLEEEKGGLKGGGQVLGKGIWEGGGFGLIFYLGVVIVGR